MLKKKNCVLLGLGILLGGTYEILKDSEDVTMNLLCIKANTMTEMKKNKKN